MDASTHSSPAVAKVRQALVRSQRRARRLGLIATAWCLLGIVGVWLPLYLNWPAWAAVVVGAAVVAGAICWLAAIVRTQERIDEHHDELAEPWRVGIDQQERQKPRR